jgi:hypothetical protein
VLVVQTYVEIWPILDDVGIRGKIVMINPHPGRVLNSDAIVVKNTRQSQILYDNICGMNNGNAIPCNRSITTTNDGLVGADPKACRKGKFSLDDDIPGSGALESFSLQIQFLAGGCAVNLQ